MSLFKNLSAFNNKICIINENDQLTFKKFTNLSDKLASKINKRSLVFLLAENDIESLASYVGLIRQKSVIAIFEKNIQREYLNHLILKYKPNYIIQPKSLNIIKGYKKIFNFKDYICIKTKFY